jgi:hypothetical protein
MSIILRGAQRHDASWMMREAEASCIMTDIERAFLGNYLYASYIAICPKVVGSDCTLRRHGLSVSALVDSCERGRKCPPTPGLTEPAETRWSVDVLSSSQRLTINLMNLRSALNVEPHFISP